VNDLAVGELNPGLRIAGHHFCGPDVIVASPVGEMQASAKHPCRAPQSRALKAAWIALAVSRLVDVEIPPSSRLHLDRADANDHRAGDGDRYPVIDPDRRSVHSLN
jgi:hypothetical protein